MSELMLAWAALPGIFGFATFRVVLLTACPVTSRVVDVGTAPAVSSDGGWRGVITPLLHCHPIGGQDQRGLWHHDVAVGLLSVT